MAMMSDIKYLHQKRLVAGQQIPIEKREHHLVLQVPPTVITRHRAHLDKIMLDLSEISEKPFDLTSVEKLYNSINDYQKFYFSFELWLYPFKIKCTVFNR